MQTNLSLHPGKTKYILFHPKRKKPDVDNVNITIDGCNTERVQHTKFLGIIIHQNLSWTPHIHAIKTKISKMIGILSKSRQVLEKITLPNCSTILWYYLIFNTALLFGYLPTKPIWIRYSFTSRKLFVSSQTLHFLFILYLHLNN